MRFGCALGWMWCLDCISTKDFGREVLCDGLMLECGLLIARQSMSYIQLAGCGCSDSPYGMYLSRLEGYGWEVASMKDVGQLGSNSFLKLLCGETTEKLTSHAACLFGGRSVPRL